MKLKEWFTDESKWIKGAAYKDIIGKHYIYVSDLERLDRKDIKSCCISGAINLCYNDEKERDRIVNRVFSRINKNDKLRFLMISEWNDNEWVNFENVKQLVNELDI